MNINRNNNIVWTSQEAADADYSALVKLERERLGRKVRTCRSFDYSIYGTGHETHVSLDLLNWLSAEQAALFAQHTEEAAQAMKEQKPYFVQVLFALPQEEAIAA